jgi:hypothetical protein
MRSKTAGYEVLNALQVGTDSEGGYLVPDEFERTLVEALQEENIFRTMAKIIQTASGDRKIPVVASKELALKLRINTSTILKMDDLPLKDVPEPLQSQLLPILRGDHTDKIPWL